MSRRPTSASSSPLTRRALWGQTATHRNRQNKYWMYESINEVLRNSFYHDPAVEARIGEYEKRVLDDKISSFIAAKELLDLYFADKAAHK